jgi:hypothetical protein
VKKRGEVLFYRDGMGYGKDENIMHCIFIISMSKDVQFTSKKTSSNDMNLKRNRSILQNKSIEV